jgi:hypothetical protein
MPWTMPNTLTPMVHSQIGSGTCQAGPPRDTPALLQITCTALNRSRVRRARSSTASASLTSVTAVATSMPPAARSAAAAARAGSSISAIITRIPSAPRRRLSASPMPLAAPVITATFPARFRMAHPFRSEPGGQP